MAVRVKSLRGFGRRKTRRPSIDAAVANVYRSATSGVPRTRKPKRASPEHNAQAALFADWLWPRLHTAAVAYAIANGGHRHKRVAAELKAEGVLQGVPDIHILHRGRSFYIEMKRPFVRGQRRGVVSEWQRATMARLERAGAICAVAEGVEDAVALLQRWGLLREEFVGDEWRVAA